VSIPARAVLSIRENTNALGNLSSGLQYYQIYRTKAGRYRNSDGMCGG
jgi:hypothetical protein